MQAVIDFLLEYYIWILAVLLILLITIIGFLADTKKKKKAREKAMNNDSQNDNMMNNNPMNGNFMNQNMGLDMNQNNQFDQSMNQNMGMYNSGINNMMDNNYNQINNMMPNDNFNNFGTNNMTPDYNNYTNANNMNANILNNNLEANNFNAGNNMINEPVNNFGMGEVNNSFNNIPNNSNDQFFNSISEQKPIIEPVNVSIPTPVEQVPNPAINNVNPSMMPNNMADSGINVGPVVTSVNEPVYTNQVNPERKQVSFQSVANEVPMNNVVNQAQTTSPIGITSNYGPAVNPIPEPVIPTPVEPIPNPIGNVTAEPINNIPNYQMPNNNVNSGQAPTMPIFVNGNQPNINNNQNING